MVEAEVRQPPPASPRQFSSVEDVSTAKVDSLKADLPSPGITVDFHGDPTEERPPLAEHM